METNSFEEQPKPMLSFIEAVRTVLKRYSDFSGRSRRSEFWWFSLASGLGAFVAVILDLMLGIAIEGLGYGPIYLLFVLGLFVPSLAVTVRRLHDINKSAWYLFLAVIPLIGAIVLFIWECKDSDRGDNRYGPSPKY